MYSEKGVYSAVPSEGIEYDEGNSRAGELTVRDAGDTTTGQVAPGEKRGAVNNGDFKTVVALSDHDEATHSDAGPSSPFLSSSHLPSPGVRWLRYRTVTVFCYMASAAAAFSMVGPTLPNLEKYLQTEIAVLGQGISAQNAGSLVGAMAVIFYFDKMNSELSLCIATLVFSLCTMAAPWWNAPWFIFMMGVRGVTGMGFSFVGITSYCMLLHKTNPRQQSIMQTTYVAYALASTLAPFISSPFLLDLKLNYTSHSNRSSSCNQTCGTSGDYIMEGSRITLLDLNPDLYDDNQNNSAHQNSGVIAKDGIDLRQVCYIYIIFGALLFIPITMLLISFCLTRDTLWHGKVELVTTPDITLGDVENVTRSDVSRNEVEIVTTSDITRNGVDIVTTSDTNRNGIDNVTTSDITRNGVDIVTTSDITRIGVDIVTKPDITRNGVDIVATSDISCNGVDIVTTSDISVPGVLPTHIKVIMWGGMAVYCFCSRVLLIVPGDILASVMVSMVNWSVRSASWLTGTFWFGNLTGNILVALTSFLLKTPFILKACVVLTFTSFVTLCFLTVLPEWLIWTTTFLAGMAQSPMFLVLLIWVAEYIPTSGFSTGIYFFIVSLGGTIAAAVVPSIFKHVTPTVVLLFPMISALLMCLSVVVMMTTSWLYKKNRGKKIAN